MKPEEMINPVLAGSYRDSITLKIKELSAKLKVNPDKLIKVMQGEKKEYPYFNFFEIDRKELCKEADAIINQLSSRQKSQQEKNDIKALKQYLRSVKGV